MGAGASAQGTYELYADLPNNASDIDSVCQARTELENMRQMLSASSMPEGDDFRSLLIRSENELAADGVSKMQARAVIKACRKKAVPLMRNAAEAETAHRTKAKFPKGRKKIRKKKRLGPARAKAKSDLRVSDALKKAGALRSGVRGDPHSVVATVSIATSQPPDPWIECKSAYGGKLSPAEEWQKLEREKVYVKLPLSRALKDVILECSGGVPDEGAKAEDEAVDAEARRPSPYLRLDGHHFSALALAESTCNLLIGLSLARNAFSEPDFLSNVGHLPFLRELSIAGNSLTQMPNLSCAPMLLSLDLSGNSLRALSDDDWPEYLAGRLRRLNLRGAAITSFDGFTICRFSALEELDLSHNSFPSIDCVMACGALSRMRRFSVLPSAFVANEPPAKVEEAVATLVARWPSLEALDGTPIKHTMSVEGAGVEEALARSIEDNLGATTRESCSCLEGNPCAVPENCKDWSRRFEVARAARQENYTKVF